MDTILIIVRSEGDFERAIAIGLAGKKSFKFSFVFVGDFSPFYRDGIQNEFQKWLFQSSQFTMLDFSDFDFVAKILKRLCGSQNLNFESARNNFKKLFQYVIFRIFNRYVAKIRKRIINRIFNEINPIFVFTDQSMTFNDYLPEQIRKAAFSQKIPVYIFTHGAAGGLHSEFSDPTFDPYENYTVLACNLNETNPNFKNRIILGDMSSSYPYVHFINKLDFKDIDFFNNRKHRVAFLIGGVMQAYTSTNGWSVQEEIIIELSERNDVAMILKLHPREARFMDLRMLERFENLLIVDNEVDRSRITKWSNIVVCNDHTSVIFEPMILGKKVVAIEGKHTPSFKNKHSPLKGSSVNFINQSSQFDLNSLKSADPLDKITNKIAWGGNGNIDISKYIIDNLSQKND